MVGTRSRGQTTVPSGYRAVTKAGKRRPRGNSRWAGRYRLIRPAGRPQKRPTHFANSLINLQFSTLASATSLVTDQPLTPVEISKDSANRILHHNRNRDSDTGMSAIVQVVTVIIVDVNIIIRVPVRRPVLRPRVHHHE
jgi:hypothetical protein